MASPPLLCHSSCFQFHYCHWMLLSTGRDRKSRQVHGDEVPPQDPGNRAGCCPCHSGQLRVTSQFRNQGQLHLVAVMAASYTPPTATGPVSLTFQVPFSSCFPLPHCFLFHEKHDSEFLSLYNNIYFCLCYWQALCQCDNTLSQFLKTARARGIRK